MGLSVNPTSQKAEPPHLEFNKNRWIVFCKKDCNYLPQMMFFDSPRP